MRTITLFILCLAIFITSSCEFQKQADAQFGDQHFKTSIALIELHKVRFGEYPKSLDELKYVADWDRIALNRVKYQRVENGYELDVITGWVGAPELTYPDEFWKGLGLIKSNMKAVNP